MLSPSIQQHVNCPIMNLPNEIIDMILSYVLANPFYTRGICKGVNSLEDSPVLIVRSVCRRFRQIANQMSFWNNEDFELLGLIPSCVPRNVPEYKINFLNALLKDQYLVQRLQRKTCWQFSDLSSFLAVIEGIPLFLQNLQSVRFVGFNPLFPARSSSINQAIGLLAKCPRLTSLTLVSCSNYLKLDCIHDSCPLLERLVIDVPSCIDGTLDALSNLRKIHIRGTSALSPLMLPMGSAASLKILKIDFWGPRPDGIDYTRTLDAFTNLTTLHIQPISIKICEFLKRSQLHLVSFSTKLDSLDSTIIVDALSAPCLQKLEHLMFQDELGLLRKDTARIVKSITKLVFIKRLELEMFLDLRWCHQFRSLSNLRHLFWKVSIDEFIDAPFASLGIQSDNPDDAYLPAVKVKKVFSALFANFPQKSQVTVEIEVLPPWDECWTDWEE